MSKWTITAAMVAATLPAAASADVCGSGLSLPANTWTMFSAPCIPPSGSTTVNAQFNTDLGTGAAYGSTWMMYKWNPSTGQYETLTADSPLEQGVGYWIYSTQAGNLKIDSGAHTTAGAVYQGNCAAYGWSGQPCYKIDLAVPASAGTAKWNLVGYPFVRPADWANVRVTYSTDSGASWTNAGVPNAADITGYISKNVHVYNDSGSSYITFDDTTSLPEDRKLRPNKSYWVRSRHVTGTTNMALLIPAPKYTVFVTSQSWSGNLGGLAGADAKCQQAANNRLILGDFRAWLSDSTTSAAERFTHSGPYVRLDGGIFASDWSTLIDGTSTIYLNLTETGSYLRTSDMTWTATNSDGSYLGPDCAGWTSASMAVLGGEGSVSYFGVGWTTFDTSVCSVSNRRLYCFEQDM